MCLTLPHTTLRVIPTLPEHAPCHRMAWPFKVLGFISPCSALRRFASMNSRSGKMFIEAKNVHKTRRKAGFYEVNEATWSHHRRYGIPLSSCLSPEMFQERANGVDLLRT